MGEHRLGDGEHTRVVDLLELLSRIRRKSPRTADRIERRIRRLYRALRRPFPKR